KNYCKRNQNLSRGQGRKMKNTCDQCMECPLCGVVLAKRHFDGKYIFMCPYCYWDTSNIKFSTAKETDLDSLIYQLKDSSNKGFLKKMYDHVLVKLKENENINSESTNRSSLQRNSVSSEISSQVNKAMEFKIWDVENIEEKITELEKKEEEK